jgi:hypothetical protein
MDCKQAIEVIKSNYPPSQYTMLREALDLAIEVLESKVNTNTTDDFQGRKTIKVPRG